MHSVQITQKKCTSFSFLHNKDVPAVSIYLRQSNKIGIKIEVGQSVEVRELVDTAVKEFGIKKEKIVLWCCGKRYNYDDENVLHLAVNTIVHVNDVDKQNCDELFLVFQGVKEGGYSRALQYKISSSIRISQFIEYNFENNQILLIESGRLLKKDRTFWEQGVSNGATIYYEFLEREVSHEEIQDDFNKLFEDEPEQEQQLTKTTRAEHKYQEEQPKIKQIKTQEDRDTLVFLDAKIKNGESSLKWEIQKLDREQISDFEEDQVLEQKPNFKKKKTICLKAVKTNPEDASYIWKRDRSYSNNKNKNKSLAFALKSKKKAKQDQTQLSQAESPRSQKMSLSAKVKLKHEFQKLFSSENLGLKGTAKISHSSCHKEMVEDGQLILDRDNMKSFDDLENQKAF